MKANNDGKAAEFLARLYLRCKGYHIIAANVITGKGTNAGEIDIIARRRKLIIFAEVKKRRTIEKAAYAISARQKERIRRGAETFIARHPQYAGFQFRFDAVLIRFPFSVRHLENTSLLQNPEHKSALHDSRFGVDPSTPPTFPTPSPSGQLYLEHSHSLF